MDKELLFEDTKFIESQKKEAQKATKITKALTSVAKLFPEDSKELKIIENIESSSALRELSEHFAILSEISTLRK